MSFLEHSDLAKIKCKVSKSNFILSRLIEKIEFRHYNCLVFLMQIFFHCFNACALRQTADACVVLQNLESCDISQPYFSHADLLKVLNEIEDEALIIY